MSRCAECGKAIRAGETVAWEDDELIHVECPVDPPCPECFLVHAGDCF